MKVSGKVIEYERYNSKSEEKLNDPHINFGSSGSKAFPVYLQSPYIFFEEYAARVIRSEMKVLDLCCGDGVHTVSLAKSNANVTAIDIAENSIKIAKLRALHERLNNIEFLVADVEKLNFGEQKFDIIILVGSLSYLDLTSLISQIKKYLKPEGKFICVDSLDHNLIYRTNRLIHYLCSRRSWSTLVRMPNMRTIKYFKREFHDVKIKYFGIFCFLGPVLTRIFNETKAKNIIDYLDIKFALLKKYSFKFVLIASNNQL